MKKILLLGMMVMIVGTAYAFGGGGSGRIGRAYDRGLNALGIHIGGNGQPDIKFKCDDPNAHPDDQGICVCNDGYVPGPDGICVPNQCIDFVPTECITACDPVTGEKTYATLCHNDEYYCDNNHECVNPCSTGEHPTDACTPSWHAENGKCIPDYAPTGTSCGTNMTCNADHECTCLTGYFWNGSACFAPCTKPNYFHRLSGTCLACDSNTRVETTADECATCGDQRKVITDGDKTYCATTNCGSENFQDIKGTCHACTISTAYPVANEEDCTTPCPTRHTEMKDNVLSCVKGCADGYEEVDGKCVCPENHFVNAEGHCISCDSKEDAIAVANKSDCSCTNRTYYRSSSSAPYYCRLSRSAQPLSNCQTAIIDGTDTLVRGYIPANTPCETSGVSGLCNGIGNCIPQNATQCTSNTACPSGWFCHTGGSMGPTDNGATPNVCEEVRPQIVTHAGKNYYYNSEADLDSWCRAPTAQYGIDCIWGFLAYQGAQNWCNAIGKRLLTTAEWSAIKDVLDLPTSPYLIGKQDYWLDGQVTSVQSFPKKDLRPDGYATKGGVICTDI